VVLRERERDGRERARKEVSGALGKMLWYHSLGKGGVKMNPGAFQKRWLCHQGVEEG